MPEHCQSRRVNNWRRNRIGPPLLRNCVQATSKASEAEGLSARGFVGFGGYIIYEESRRKNRYIMLHELTKAKSKNGILSNTVSHSQPQNTSSTLLRMQIVLMYTRFYLLDKMAHPLVHSEHDSLSRCYTQHTRSDTLVE